MLMAVMLQAKPAMPLLLLRTRAGYFKHKELYSASGGTDRVNNCVRHTLFSEFAFHLFVDGVQLFYSHTSHIYKVKKGFLLGRVLAIAVLFLCFLFMTIAYNYRIKYADGLCLVFLDEILLATIQQRCESKWEVNIKISGQNYVFAKPGKLNSPVSIHDINAGEKLGNISVPLFPFFFRSSVFLRENKPSISWCSKNFYSIHWIWKQGDDIMLEGVEDFMSADNSGVIKLSANLDEPFLLIITGIFLSMSRKRRGIYGLFSKKQNKANETENQHHLTGASYFF